MLLLVSNHHGTPTPVPSNAFVFRGAAIDNMTVQHAVKLLKTTFNIPGVGSRVSIICGAASHILLLTNFILEQGLNPDEFAIRYIYITSRYLTKRWQKILQNTWKAKIVNRYSLSEIFGGATSYDKSDGFCFDPHVVPEIVDLVSHKPIDNGVGILVLTSLYPFVQLQPFIRYWTGDLFSLDQGNSLIPQYKFLGRLSHALFDPDDSGRLLLSGVALIEAIDKFPEVNRSKLFQNITSLRDHGAAGQPIVRGLIYRVGKKINLELQVELVVNPSLFPKSSSMLRKTIYADLISRSRSLASEVEKGRITLNVNLLCPGSLEHENIQSFGKKTLIWELV